MAIRILDLDGSIVTQPDIRAQGDLHDLRAWGPKIRMACGFRAFGRFEAALAEALVTVRDERPGLTLYGSGDFHHVSLALLRRIGEPVNLLVIDKHPDWMRAVPVIHCGTWVYHAGKLPHVRTIFHVGGDLDFDNAYRPLAPWSWLRSGKVRVLPAVRSFSGGGWNSVATRSLRPDAETPLSDEWLAGLLAPHRDELAARPLYVSFDKDALRDGEAVVNWDSGRLTTDEGVRIVQAFLDAAKGKLAGADGTGDWSPVETTGLLRRFLDLTEHPRLAVRVEVAAALNAEVNRRYVAALGL